MSEFLMSICYWFRRLLIRALLPVTKLLGHIYLAPKSRAIRRYDIEAIVEELINGDVVLSYTSGEISNYLIPGEYKHCGIYAGNNKIIEATSKGVVLTEIDDFCSNKDKIAICRPLFCDERKMLKAVTYARDRRGSPYDYYFEPNEHAFYCAELIAKAYYYATDGLTPFETRESLGVHTVLPIDFKLAKSKFETVLERP